MDMTLALQMFLGYNGLIIPSEGESYIASKWIRLISRIPFTSSDSKFQRKISPSLGVSRPQDERIWDQPHLPLRKKIQYM